MPAKPKKKKHVAKSLSPAREEPQDSEEETVPPPPRGAQQQQPPASASASARGRGRGRGTRSRGDSQQKKQHADTETHEEQTRKTRETEEETDQQETVSGGAVDKQKRTKADPAFMTREQEVDFADWLKENPHHYDMSNVEFRLKERKAREWEEKATQYNLTSQQLRTRFKTLRDIVNKDKRKGKSGDGAKSLSKRNQFVVETFGFLSQYSHERPSRDTLRVAQVPAEGPRGDDRSSENTDEEERGDEGAENSDATEARAQGPKKRTWKKKKPKQAEQHQELMETLQRAMEENTAVKTQVQQAIDGAGAGTSVDPERAMFGQWFVTALPKIDDEFWLEFRAKINATVQMYQERTSMLRKRGGGQLVPQPQPEFQYPHIVQAIPPPFHPQQVSVGQQQPEQPQPRTYTHMQTVPSQSGKYMPEWMRAYQTPAQDAVFPDHQTTFATQQLDHLDAPVGSTPTVTSSAYISRPPNPMQPVRTSTPTPTSQYSSGTDVDTQNAQDTEDTPHTPQ